MGLVPYTQYGSLAGTAVLWLRFKFNAILITSNVELNTSIDYSNVALNSSVHYNNVVLNACIDSSNAELHKAKTKHFHEM